MNINYHNSAVKRVMSYVQHYNHKKYWKRRAYAVKTGGFAPYKLYCLLYVKRCDAFNKASMGTDYGAGAEFAEPPILPHGLNGIVVSPQCVIGRHVKLFHQVTLGNDYKEIDNAPTIGDNVTVFPGAKVFGRITIGDNSVIGANAVVNFDVPENSVVVCQKSRVLLRKSNNEL